MNRYREIKYADGMPCSHPACHAHKSHPCEVCGRIQCIGDVYENPFMRGLNKKEYPERVKVFIIKENRKVIKWQVAPFIDMGVEYIRADEGEEVEKEIKMFELKFCADVEDKYPQDTAWMITNEIDLFFEKLLETYTLIKKEK